MDTKYIEPFVEATINVFNDFFKETPRMSNPYLISSQQDHQWDISAVIGIAGESRGAVAISFTEGVAKELTSILVGRKIDVINEDVIDSAGEVVNIIAGNAKKGLEEYRLVISLPSIVSGLNHKIAWPSKTMPIICIPFTLPQGNFHVSVGLENIIK